MTTTSRHLRPYLVKEWPALAGASAMTVLLTAADLAKPWPLKLVIDNLLAGHHRPFALSSNDWRLLGAIALLVVAISLVEAIGDYCSDLWLQSAGERITHNLRIALYDHLQRLSLRFHMGRQKGDLVTRVTGDVNAIGDLFATSLGNLAQSALVLLGMLAVAIAIDPVLGLVTGATLPLLALVSFTFRRRVRAGSRRQRAQEGEIASRAGEALSAMPVVKALGSEDLERERVTGLSRSRMAIGIQLSRVQAAYDGLVGVLSAAGTAAVVVVGVIGVADGKLTPGELIVFATYARRASAPMRAIAKEATRVSRTMARAERIAEILAVDDMLVDRPGGYRGPRAEGAVDLDRVSFSYEGGRDALNDVSFSVAPGEHVAVIGPSGAGKSTLAALIARFHDPASGSVMIDGRDARDCSLEWLRRQVGVLLQDTVLFTGTVEENIGYGSDAAFAEVVDAARLAAADGFIDSLPAGYDTELGPQGGGLSGGQRQRLGIARTLLRDPSILILDEPTTGLDVESEAQVLEGLEGLMHGRTTLMVTHSLALAGRADRVVVMDDGRIVADGPAGTVLAEDGPWRRLTQRRRRTRARGSVPVDRDLPQLGRMLDADQMADALQRSLGSEGVLGEVVVRRVMYRPHERLTVHYRAKVGDAEHDAVAQAARDGDLERRAASAAYREVARMVHGRSPAVTPVGYDTELNALVSWLPFDDALPAVFEPPERLLHRLAWAGLRLGEDERDVTTVRYKPRRRAVLRVDGHILKAYGRPRDYAAALAGAECGRRAVPTTPFEVGLSDLRVLVHRAVEQLPRPEPAGAAARAGDLLRHLHAAPPLGLTRAMPEDELASARSHAALAAAVVPVLAPRLDALVERLAAAMPSPRAYVASHGDFRAGRLRAVGEDRLLVDFDGMCLAPPALDLAAYTADVIRGGGGDWDAVAAVLEPLLDGYGERPEALGWYLAAAILRRASRPFSRQVADWPSRVQAIVLTAEEALDA